MYRTLEWHSDTESFFIDFRSERPFLSSFTIGQGRAIVISVLYVLNLRNVRNYDIMQGMGRNAPPEHN